MKPILAASILSANFSCLESDIQACEGAGIDWIHVDVMDGHFVPNITMGPVVVKALRRITSLPLDCHLMIEKPEAIVEAFVEAGATSITIHPENNPNVHRSLNLIHKLGASCGLAVNPGTNIEVIEPLLPFVDMILVMTVNPGYSGQAFIPEMTGKVAAAAELISRLNPTARLEVDGGINSSNVHQLKQSGADTFVSASSIFGHPSGIPAGIKALRDALG